MNIRRGGVSLPLVLSSLAMPQGSVAGDTVRYSYDALGRLQTVERRAIGSQGALDSYAYDPASNRSKVQSSGAFKGDTIPWRHWLNAGETLLSSDARFRLTLQFDGDVALYGPQNNLMWHTGTSGSGANWLTLQNDGNLVLYTPAQQPVWASNTAGQFESHLTIQTDGNLVLYRADGTPTWYTSTSG